MKYLLCLWLFSAPLALLLVGCASLSARRPTPAPTGGDTAGVRELLAELRQLGAISTLYLDTRYYLPTQDEALSWFRSVKWYPYQSQSWDCEDYVLQCMLAAREANQSLRPGFGPAVGMLAYETSHATIHAVIIFRCSDGLWHAYDPILRLEIRWPSRAIHYVIL